MAIGGVVGGSPPGDVTTPFAGSIDEPAVYNRELSAAEILAIYSAGSAGKCGGAVPPTGPSIVTQPASQTVAANGSATFTVVATGTAPLTYQWRFNTTNINGATSSSLTLTNVQLANSGSYSV